MVAEGEAGVDRPPEEGDGPDGTLVLTNRVAVAIGRAVFLEIGAEADAGHHGFGDCVETLHLHDGVGPVCGVPGRLPMAPEMFMKSSRVVIALVCPQRGQLPRRTKSLAHLDVDCHLVARRPVSCLSETRTGTRGERRDSANPTARRATTTKGRTGAGESTHLCRCLSRTRTGTAAERRDPTRAPRGGGDGQRTGRTGGTYPAIPDAALRPT